MKIANKYSDKFLKINDFEKKTETENDFEQYDSNSDSFDEEYYDEEMEEEKEFFPYLKKKNSFIISKNQNINSSNKRVSFLSKPLELNKVNSVKNDNFFGKNVKNSRESILLEINNEKNINSATLKKMKNSELGFGNSYNPTPTNQSEKNIYLKKNQFSNIKSRTSIRKSITSQASGKFNESLEEKLINELLEKRKRRNMLISKTENESRKFFVDFEVAKNFKYYFPHNNSNNIYSEINNINRFSKSKKKVKKLIFQSMFF